MADKYNVKLSDISKQLGLSISTVSAVLGQKDTRHSAETKARILELAEKLNYKPNFAARSLRSRRTSTIGLVAPLLTMDIDEVEEVCSAAGYTLTVGIFHNSLERQSNRILEMKQKNIDGLLLINPVVGCDVIRNLAQESYPIVISDVAVNYPIVDTFIIDIEGSIRVAVEHLASLGHRKIALISTDSKSDYSRLRKQSWETLMPALGHRNYSEYIFLLDRMTYPAKYSVLKSAYNCAKNIVNRFSIDDPARPTAVVAVADDVAIGAMKGFQDCGWSVPCDISIISAEKSEFGEYCNVSLTAIMPKQEQCRKDALKRLIAIINDEVEDMLPIQKKYQVELVPGKSTARVTNRI